MSNRTIQIGGLCVALIVTAPKSRAMAQHAGDVFPARTASGQLTLGGFLPDINVIALPPVTGLFEGWADNDPGFDRLITPDAENDLFPLAPGAQIRIEGVSLDTGFRAISPSFVIIDAPGERILLGNENLHIHLTWHINSEAPGFDPMRTVWRATCKFVDTGSTGYADSEPFTYRFANVDCLTGDVNGDTFRDGKDVQTFVYVMLNTATAPEAERCGADADRDGLVTLEDIPAFVAVLLDGSSVFDPPPP